MKSLLADFQSLAHEGPHPGHIEIKNLYIRLGRKEHEFEAVQNISISIQPGEFVCLLGPSGCGKSTLLGALAGHLRGTTGSIQLDSQSIDGPHPDRGLVFQQHTLFPWKRILDNVAFGLKMRGMPRAERQMARPSA